MTHMNILSICFLVSAILAVVRGFPVAGSGAGSSSGAVAGTNQVRMLNELTKRVTVQTFETNGFNKKATSDVFVIDYTSLDNYFDQCHDLQSGSNLIKITKSNFGVDENSMCALKLYTRSGCSHFTSYVRVNINEFNDEMIKFLSESFNSYKIGCSGIYSIKN